MQFRVLIMDWERADRDGRWDLQSHCDRTQSRAVRQMIKVGAFRSYLLSGADPEYIYTLLNGDERPVGYDNRSMSMGDVVEDEEGRMYICGAIGFRLLE